MDDAAEGVMLFDVHDWERVWFGHFDPLCGVEVLRAGPGHTANVSL